MKIISKPRDGTQKNNFYVECVCGCSCMRVMRHDIFEEDEPAILIDFLNGYVDKKAIKTNYYPEIVLSPEKAFDVVRFIDIKTITTNEIAVPGKKKNEQIVLYLNREKRNVPAALYDYDIAIIYRKKSRFGKIKKVWLGAIVLENKEFVVFGKAFEEMYYNMMEKVENALVDSGKE